MTGEDSVVSQQNPLFGSGLFGGFGTGTNHAILQAVTQSIECLRVGEFLANYLYAYSWAAAAMIDIPIDDIWRNGLRWVGQDEADEKKIEAMEAEEKRLHAHWALAQAMKAARLYGSAAIVAFVDGQDPEEPLNLATVKPGSLKNLVIRNQYSLSINSLVGDVFMEDYGKPYQYLVSLPTLELDERSGKKEFEATLPDAIRDKLNGGQVPVHASRIFRFDGHRPPAQLRLVSSQLYDSDWGESMLTRAVGALTRDEDVQDAFGSLAKESSIFAITVQGLSDMIKGRVHEGEVTVDDIARNISKLRANHRTLFLDAGDKAERIAVAFSGVGDIIDRYAVRLAMIAGIPATRMLSKAPDGMNATGEGDNANYQLTLSSIRQNMLGGVIGDYYELLAASAGLAEPPEYQWEDTFTMDPAKVAKNSEMQTKAVIAVFGVGAVTLTEARELLPETWFGPLGPPPPELLAMEKVEEEKGQAELETMLNDPDDDDGPPGG